MLRSLAVTALSVASMLPLSFAGETAPVQNAVYYPGGSNAAHVTTVAAYRHRRHRHGVRKTIKRVGLGAAGGAATGALIGGGPGAAVGAVVGGGAGAIYDHHEKSIGK